VNAVRTSGSPRTIIALLSISAMVVSLLAASPAPATNDCTSPPAVMPTSQLVSGMKGSGVTTIRGTTPTPFEVEVLGVMDNYIWLDIPAIVVRITGPDTFLDEVGGVFYGMSGSPVSVNGKLIGSVSYAVSWDPTIVGLTPAQAMVDLFELEKAGAPSLPEQIPFDDATRRSIAAATGRSPSEVVGGLQLLPTYLGVSGLSAARLTELQGMLDERGSRFQLVPASGMSANLPVTSTRFVAGQPIGSVLSWGDVTVWAAGTVAIACADEVVAFGHSLFWSPPGELAIGMTGAEVLAVGNGQGLWAGDMVPVLTEPRGTFRQDRFAGQSGFVGQAPPSAPITSAVRSLDTGASRDGLTDAIFHDDWWLQSMVWAHLVLNFGAVQGGLGPGTSELSYTVEGTRGDGSSFSVSNRTMWASQWDATEAVYKLVNAIDQLVYNGFEPVEITAVDSTGSITSEQLVGTITKVRTSSSLQPKLRSRGVLDVRPGERVTVEVTFSPLDGGAATKDTFSLVVPRHGSGGKVSLRGGRESWWSSRVDSFDELLESLSGGEHYDDLVVTAFGDKLLLSQPLVVQGKASFTIHMVR